MKNIGLVVVAASMLCGTACAAQDSAENAAQNAAQYVAKDTAQHAGKVSTTDIANETATDTAIIKQEVKSPESASLVVLDEPARRTRKRLLIDLGLFGMGIQVGWMKPKSALDPDVSDHHIGMPIFNVSGGSHAVGLGTR